MFANALGDRVPVPGRIIPKTQKMVFDTSLLTTKHYKIRIKGKWSNPGKEDAPSQHLGVVIIWKGAFRSPSTMVGLLTNIWYCICSESYYEKDNWNVFSCIGSSFQMLRDLCYTYYDTAWGHIYKKFNRRKSSCLQLLVYKNQHQKSIQTHLKIGNAIGVMSCVHQWPGRPEFKDTKNGTWCRLA